MEKIYDVVVIGASLGGTMAAISALRSGLCVALTEATDWIGGQLTSQAIPPDEHRYIEKFGCTKSYREHRKAIREVYRTQYPLLEEIKAQENFDPGASSVSRVAHDPRISLRLLQDQIQPYLESGHLTLYLETTAICARVCDGVIKSVCVQDEDGVLELCGKYFIDGTDQGDLLPLVGADYTFGAESQAMTGEPHALPTYLPHDMQSVTWAAAMRYDPSEDLPMEKPAMFDYFAKLRYSFIDHPLLGWYGPALNQPTGRRFKLFDDEPGDVFPLWSYRRILYPDHFTKGAYAYEATILNWPQNDYPLGNIMENLDAERHAYRAGQLTLSLVYWLKYFAPRPDGGQGYSGISLDGDFTGTQNGLAKAPYIRESRRIKGLLTITENMISTQLAEKPPVFTDSVGVGCYHIDLHCTTATNTLAFWETWPFEIPLRAMIPQDIENLLPGCKNIATTHLTNGCYRVHPCEWNIGESAGYIAAHAIAHGKTPKQMAQSPALVLSLQERLLQAGIELHWPKDIGAV